MKSRAREFRSRDAFASSGRRRSHRARERDKEFSRLSAVFFPSSMRGGFFLENLYARAVEVDAKVRCARARLKRVEIDVLRVKNGFVSMERRVECVIGAGFRNRFFVSGALMGLSLRPPLPCFFNSIVAHPFSSSPFLWR